MSQILQGSEQGEPADDQRLPWVWCGGRPEIGRGEA